MPDFRCPKCGSSDTSSCEMVYAAGTNSGHIGGAAIDSDGDIAIGGGRTSSMTTLAASVAPPAKETGGVLSTIFGVTGLAICLPFVFGRRGRDDLPIAVLLPLTVVFAGLLAYGIFRIRPARQYNSGVWVALHRRWRETWLCKRCGKTFIPESDVITCSQCGAEITAPANRSRLRCPKCESLLVA